MAGGNPVLQVLNHGTVRPHTYAAAGMASAYGVQPRRSWLFVGAGTPIPAVVRRTSRHPGSRAALVLVRLAYRPVDPVEHAHLEEYCQQDLPTSRFKLLLLSDQLGLLVAGPPD